MSVTSLSNPQLFAGAPVLPADYYYQLDQTGYTYAYGYNEAYVISVIRASDQAQVFGVAFYPNSAYTDAQTMITTEATNTYNRWNSVYNEAALAAATQALVGF